MNQNHIESACNPGSPNTCTSVSEVLIKNTQFRSSVQCIKISLWNYKMTLSDKLTRWVLFIVEVPILHFYPSYNILCIISCHNGSLQLVDLYP